MLTFHSTGRSSRGLETEESSRHADRRRSPTPKRYDSPAKTSETTLRPAATPTSTGSSSYSSFKTGEDRAAFIKAQAEQRMAERLAALGLKPPTKPGESAQQRQEREKKEREDRLRQAEAEDNKREQERQRRLADEQVSPPSASKSSGKKPPPPPTRKSRAGSTDQVEVKKKAEDDARKAQLEHEGKEKAIRDQQEVQEAETRNMEYVQSIVSRRSIHLLIIFTGMKRNAKRTNLPRSVRQRKFG